MMDRDADMQLVSDLREGDQQAFALAYDRYRSHVFTFILRMVNRREIADELSQEVWMRLAARAASLRADTRLEPWLFTVARNLCVSYWRTRGVEGMHDPDPDAVDTLPAHGVPPDRSAESREAHKVLERALARLPRPYREALLLVGAQGMTPATAAGVCGITAEAMRKRLERGREMLAREMEAVRCARTAHEERS